MNKAVEELNKRIEMLEERLKEEKLNAIESINRVERSRMGITKYSEEVSKIVAKIEAYRDAILIMEYFEKDN